MDIGKLSQEYESAKYGTIAPSGAFFVLYFFISVLCVGTQSIGNALKITDTQFIF